MKLSIVLLNIFSVDIDHMFIVIDIVIVSLTSPTLLPTMHFET